MLQFYYDFLCKYIERSSFEYLEMDTDSAYFGISTLTLEDAVKPELKGEFIHKLRESCYDNNFIADHETWFPRECCQKHIKYDKRTPGLFKLEAQGEEMYALCSKTYLLKAGNDFKVTCKGINKSAVIDPLTIFREALIEKKTVSAHNRGFRARDNTIYSYMQERIGFGYFYCKRRVLEDGVTTEPLDMVLCPWTNHHFVSFNDEHPLGLTHQSPINKDGIDFYSIGQLYEFQKAMFHHQPQLADSIINSPLEWANIGSKISLSTEWYEARDKIMKDNMRLKMQQNQYVHTFLVYGKVFVYVSKLYPYWSCGFHDRMVEVSNANQFTDNNRLGQLWGELCEASKLTDLNDQDMQVIDSILESE